MSSKGNIDLYVLGLARELAHMVRSSSLLVLSESSMFVDY